MGKKKFAQPAAKTTATSTDKMQKSVDEAANEIVKLSEGLEKAKKQSNSLPTVELAGGTYQFTIPQFIVPGIDGAAHVKMTAEAAAKDIELCERLVSDGFSGLIKS